MFLQGILAISGQPGLFKQVTQGKNNVIVESLLTGKRMPAFITARISALEDVAIYTTGDEKPLIELFISLFNYTKGEPCLVANKNEMIDVFSSILPDYDSDKVYISDIKKVFLWYNVLIEKGIITEESIKEAQLELEKPNKETNTDEAEA
jgi:hypothetical protein